MYHCESVDRRENWLHHCPEVSIVIYNAYNYVGTSKKER